MCAQFQNKYASHRALLRNGEHLTPSLVVGVKPLDPRHRSAIEGYDAANGSPVQVGLRARLRKGNTAAPYLTSGHTCLQTCSALALGLLASMCKPLSNKQAYMLANV